MKTASTALLFFTLGCACSAAAPVLQVTPLDVSSTSPHARFLVNTDGRGVEGVEVWEVAPRSALAPTGAPIQASYPLKKAPSIDLGTLLRVPQPPEFPVRPLRLVFVPVHRGDDKAAVEYLRKFLAEPGWEARFGAWRAAGVQIEIANPFAADPAPQPASVLQLSDFKERLLDKYSEMARGSAEESAPKQDFGTKLAQVLAKFDRVALEGKALRTLPLVVVLWTEAGVVVDPDKKILPAPPLAGTKRGIVLNLADGFSAKALVAPFGAVPLAKKIAAFSANNDLLYSAVPRVGEQRERDFGSLAAVMDRELQASLSKWQIVTVESGAVAPIPARSLVFRFGAVESREEFVLTPAVYADTQRRLAARLSSFLANRASGAEPFYEAVDRWLPAFGPGSRLEAENAIYSHVDRRMDVLLAIGREGLAPDHEASARKLAQDFAARFPQDQVRGRALMLKLTEATKRAVNAELVAGRFEKAESLLPQVVDLTERAHYSNELHYLHGLKRITAGDYEHGRSDLEAWWVGNERTKERVQAAAEAVLGDSRAGDADFAKWLGRVRSEVREYSSKIIVSYGRVLATSRHSTQLLERAAWAGLPAAAQAALKATSGAAAAERAAWLEFALGNPAPWRAMAGERFAAESGESAAEAFQLLSGLSAVEAALPLQAAFAAVAGKIGPPAALAALSDTLATRRHADWAARVKAKLVDDSSVSLPASFRSMVQGAEAMLATRFETTGRDGRVSFELYRRVGDGQWLKLEISGALTSAAGQAFRQLSSAKPADRRRGLLGVRFADCEVALPAAAGFLAEAHGAGVRDVSGLAPSLLKGAGTEFVEYLFVYDSASSRAVWATPGTATAIIEDAAANNPSADYTRSRKSPDGRRHVDTAARLLVSTKDQKTGRQFTNASGSLRLGLLAP